MLVVQVVQILWTKASRGAPRAKERVGLPRAFPIAGNAGLFIVERHRVAEWEDFLPRSTGRESAASVAGSVDVLRIHCEAGGHYVLGISGTPPTGQPPRHPIPRAIALAPGEYARLTLNARHTTTRGQYYAETIYNVACGDAVPADRFLRGAPEHELDLKVNLF